MKMKITLLSIVVAELLVAAVWVNYRTKSATPGIQITAVPPPLFQDLQRLQIVNGETVVMVGVDAQRASHITVQPVSLAIDQPELTAYATVLDLQVLFELGNRYIAARAEHESARAHTEASRWQYERTRILFQDDHNASQKSLQDALVMMQADEAKLQATKAMLNGMEAALRQQYGNALTAAVLSPGSALYGRLLSGYAAIARVTLPEGSSLSAPQIITIDGSDGKTSLAHKLSPSPLVDPAVQGNSYLYVTDSVLPVGTHTLAHVAVRNKKTADTPGFRIPEAAIVWYGGQSWAYIKTDATHFTRRYVPTEPVNQPELIVTHDFHANDKVVISGAQLLLSEELRPQGLAAQLCKDPPECDD